MTFLNLEDETGMLNVICTQGVWARHRKVARTAACLVVRGMVEHGANMLASSRRGSRELEGQTSIKRGYLNLIHAREAVARHATLAEELKMEEPVSERTRFGF